jgi:hypothetical protein
MPYAQLNGDNIAKAVTDQPIGIPCEWSDCGRKWNGTSFEDLPAPKIHTHRSFLKRFTGAEFKAIRSAAKNDGDVDMFMYLFERSQQVDLDDVDTIAGVQMLVTKGILTAPRAAVILA